MGTTETISDDAALDGGERKPSLRVRILWIAAKFDGMMQRRRSRLALMEMTDEQLKDIGISRCDAYREGVRPFWD